ncbi:MAG: carbamoyltransferase C-terminal domain-containing protein [Pseudomonadota bacterium]
MIILGINEDHNATAAIINNGAVLACQSEERNTRRKNDTEYPWQAIDTVLGLSGISPGDIDYVAFAGKYCDALQMKLKRVTTFSIQDYIREMHQYWKKILIEKQVSNFYHEILREERFSSATDRYYDYGFMEKAPEQQWPAMMNEERKNTVVRHLGIGKDRIRFIDHHIGHAHYAFYASPHNSAKKCAIVTADGWGDGCNATISIVENGVLREVHRTPMCNMARMYRWITLLLGMKPNEHEYKVMGLAPYAQDYVREPVYEIFKETLVVHDLDFVWNKKPSDMYFYFRDQFEGLRFDGIAAGLQMWLEDLLTEWITNIMAKTNADVLYYSGGLSMNVKANKVIAGLPCIQEIHIPPSGGDESLAIGAAYALSRELGDEPLPLEHAYLGYEPSLAESKNVSEPFRHKAGFQVVDEPDVDAIAALLVKGKVLGRCCGRMEFGARALGNRSILCNPSKFENLRLINEKIKFRDFWMPFTPSILEERARDYLHNPKGLPASYMTLAFDSTALARDHIKAAMHPYDFTIRPQLVAKETNPDYYGIIKAFEKRTGIGALLNTSQNLHGDPIVCTAADAIDTFMKSGLDGMLLPGILILKQD